MYSCELELGGGILVDKISLFQTKIQSEEEVVAAEDVMDDDDEDGALEALFKQLEEDLENDDLSVDDDEDEISEEDMARFEKELAEAIEEVGSVDESAGDPLLSSADYGDDEQLGGSERPELKTWQLRRLARALKIGRRKTSVSCYIFTLSFSFLLLPSEISISPFCRNRQSFKTQTIEVFHFVLQIKNLAGELGLDRALVIELLRNPPPKLLLMSDSLPDEAPSKPEVKELEPPSSATVDEVDTTEIKPQEELPVHVMSAEWSARKRLKKVQLETLERVYLRSKRPTVTSISININTAQLLISRVVAFLYYFSATYNHLHYFISCRIQ